MHFGALSSVGIQFAYDEVKIKLYSKKQSVYLWRYHLLVTSG